MHRHSDGVLQTAQAAEFQPRVQQPTGESKDSNSSHDTVNPACRCFASPHGLRAGTAPTRDVAGPNRALALRRHTWHARTYCNKRLSHGFLRAASSSPGTVVGTPPGNGEAQMKLQVLVHGHEYESRTLLAGSDQVSTGENCPPQTLPQACRRM